MSEILTGSRLQSPLTLLWSLVRGGLDGELDPPKRRLCRLSKILDVFRYVKTLLLNKNEEKLPSSIINVAETLAIPSGILIEFATGYPSQALPKTEFGVSRERNYY